MSKPTAQFLLFLICVVVLCYLCSGCALLQRKGLIKSGGVSVAAVADAGKPATLTTSDAKEAVKIPSGSTLTVTKEEAVPATDKAAFRPAKETWEYHFTGETEWQKFNTTVAANTGTVDTSVALHKIDVSSKQPFLYAAILGALGAILFVYLHYPTPAMLCGLASGLFFLAWKLSDLPSWVWAVAAAAIAAGVAMYFAHERGLKTATASPVPASPKVT